MGEFDDHPTNGHRRERGLIRGVIVHTLVAVIGVIAMDRAVGVAVRALGVIMSVRAVGMVVARTGLAAAAQGESERGEQGPGRMR